MDSREREYAASFDRYRSRATDATEEVVRSVLRCVPSSEDARIIDVGCGTGRYALPLASSAAAAVFATDLSRDMLKKGLEKAGADAVAWCLSDARRLPFADDTFDAALLFLVLHLVKQPDQVLAETYRILRPGGSCLIMTHSFRQLDRSTLFRFFPEARRINKKRMLSLSRLKGLLRETGFRGFRARELVESVVYPPEAFLEKVRSRPNTSLRAMSDKHFERAFRTLEAALADRQEFSEESFITLVAVRKQVPGDRVREQREARACGL